MNTKIYVKRELKLLETILLISSILTMLYFLQKKANTYLYQLIINFIFVVVITENTEWIYIPCVYDRTLSKK